LRAEPKNFLGLFRALASMPPLRTLPDGGMMALWARASRVIESRRMTTSRLISTSRLAFSRTMLATWALRAGGSSNVEATTSPPTLRWKGRLSRPGRRDDQSALALADGGHELHDPGVEVLGIAVLELDHLVRIERRELLEVDVSPGIDENVGMGEVDRLDLDQGEVPLAILGGAHLAGDGVSGMQVEFSYL
jgi:hypothetical protein